MTTEDNNKTVRRPFHGRDGLDYEDEMKYVDEIRKRAVTNQMKFEILHSCNGGTGIMEDITRDPEILDRNVERPFRVFRCPGCKLEIKVEKLG